MDIAVFWGIDDVIETRPCTCSPRGCLNTNDTSGAADKYQQQNTLSQCPCGVWLHDSQNARDWLEVTEIDREQVSLMVSLINLCFVHSAISFFFSQVSSFAFNLLFSAWLLRDLANYWTGLIIPFPTSFHCTCQSILYISFIHSRPFYYFLMRFGTQLSLSALVLHPSRCAGWQLHIIRLPLAFSRRLPHAW